MFPSICQQEEEGDGEEEGRPHRTSSNPKRSRSKPSQTNGRKERPSDEGSWRQDETSHGIDHAPLCQLPYPTCVPSEGGVALDESGDQPRPSDAAVMEQQMTYGGPEYSIDWEEVKRGKAAGMPGKWVSVHRPGY